MRLATAVSLFLVFVGLTVLVIFGVVLSGQGGTLEEQWVSDTPRDNQVNHHAVGVGPDGQVVVAPVAAVPNSGVTLTNTSCALVRLAPSNGSVIWRNGVPAEDCFTHALTEPAIGEIDGDGGLEVVSSTTEGAAVVIDAKTGREEFRVPLVTYGYGRPTVADLSPEPGREVLTSDINGHVVLARADGTVAWRTSLNRTFDRRLAVWDAPTVADVDDDGGLEIIIGTNAGPAILSANGTVTWSNRTTAKDIAVAQGDGDPQLELFAAATQTVRSIDGRTHEVEWKHNFEEIPRIRATVDGDDDGTLELYVGLSDGTTESVDAEDGDVEWSTQVSSGDTTVANTPVLANVDGSGPPEVVVTTRDGTVAVLDAGSGSELAAYERSVPVWTFPTPADLDDDGDDEILVRFGDGRVVALDYSS